MESNFEFLRRSNAKYNLHFALNTGMLVADKLNFEETVEILAAFVEYYEAEIVEKTVILLTGHPVTLIPIEKINSISIEAVEEEGEPQETKEKGSVLN